MSLTLRCIFPAIIALILVSPASNAQAKPEEKKAALKPAAAPSPAATKPSSGTSIGTPDLDLSKEPTNISADSLTLLNEKRTFTYQGKVVVTQGDMTLNADFVDGTYSDKNEIQTITARQNVVITKGVDMKANGQKAQYNAVARTIELTESPSIEQNGSILTADIIRIFIDENRSVAEGNVKVTLKNTGDALKSKPAEGAKP